jgi:IS5 family transposase
MIPRKKDPNLLNMFSHFEDILNHTHPLFTLAQKVRWSIFEEAFLPLYSQDAGATGKIYQVDGRIVDTQAYSQCLR